jgi:hypothetical protein
MESNQSNSKLYGNINKQQFCWRIWSATARALSRSDFTRQKEISKLLDVPGNADNQHFWMSSCIWSIVARALLRSDITKCKE